jgi:hypothetical protein
MDVVMLFQVLLGYERLVTLWTFEAFDLEM